jgi:hypothetical protein
VTTQSPGSSLPAMPKNFVLCAAKRPDSWNESRSTSRSTRSRAVSFPEVCCFPARSAPPPSFRRFFARSRSRIFSRRLIAAASVGVILRSCSAEAWADDASAESRTRARWAGDRPRLYSRQVYPKSRTTACCSTRVGARSSSLWTAGVVLTPAGLEYLCRDTI